ncbi:MAG TPA: 2'-5' RNA ligase family protein [Candidatus Paceibacterota bacterium]
MKFFIGIVPPSVTKERIFEFQSSFPSNKVPYFHEPHITLKAPSGLTEDKVWLVKVATLLGDYDRFQIAFDGLDCFDDKVLFLKLTFSQELMGLHMQLVSLLSPDTETNNKFYEGSIYHPHLTLGETTWGGMTQEELDIMRKRAEFELHNIPPFQVDFVRVFQKEKDSEPYQKLLDIPLKI